MYITIFRSEKTINFTDLEYETQEEFVWDSKVVQAKKQGINIPSFNENVTDAMLNDIFDKIEAFPAIIEECVYETCNYKGEGIGFIFESLGKTLPIYRGR